MTPAKLYEHANRAAADAMRFRRQPNGDRLALLRARDALALRAIARRMAQEQAQDARSGSAG